MTNDPFKGLELPVDLAAKMPIRHPSTQQPLRSADGQEEAYIELYSSESPIATKKRRETMRRRLNQRGRGRITPEEIEAEGVELLVALTKNWKLLNLEGAALDIPCTPENARKLYTSEKMSWVRSQVDEFTSDIANFSPALSTN